MILHIDFIYLYIYIKSGLWPTPFTSLKGLGAVGSPVEGTGSAAGAVCAPSSGRWADPAASSPDRRQRLGC